ncbi:MAG: hypothetical protein IPF82_11770 [Blastocatellia bacterium]|nr:hypothetical protein [Blastocatellia bacterium]
MRRPPNAETPTAASTTDSTSNGRRARSASHIAEARAESGPDEERRQHDRERVHG